MTRLEKIEQQITRLSDEELEAFRTWFAEYDSEHWDEQLEQDAKSGKLDDLADEAVADHRAGRTRPL